MYLKTLRLENFKCYPGSISLNFSPGITAIIGHKGTGKSSILDALRWVLGQQQLSERCGRDGGDLIYNGRELHSLADFAHVDIVIDNADCSISQMRATEIAITRNCHRNGAETVYINDNALSPDDVAAPLCSSIQSKFCFWSRDNFDPAMFRQIVAERKSTVHVLDNVDSILGKSARSELAENVKQAAIHTQFIVVPHYNSMMKIADTIYGITVDTHGARRLLTVDGMTMT